MITSSNGSIFRVTGPLCGEFPYKGQWRGALMLSLICARTNGWVNNREAGDLRRHRAHYDITLMGKDRSPNIKPQPNNVFTFLLLFWLGTSQFIPVHQNHFSDGANNCFIDTKVISVYRWNLITNCPSVRNKFLGTIWVNRLHLLRELILPTRTCILYYCKAVHCTHISLFFMLYANKPQ